jgi:hypothetical protein
MFASKTIPPIVVLALLLGPGVATADVLQLKCLGTNADVRYAKVQIGGGTYYTDKFGKIAVPSIATMAGKNVTVYSLGNQGATVQVPSSGQVYAPCR